MCFALPHPTWRAYRNQKRPGQKMLRLRSHAARQGQSEGHGPGAPRGTTRAAPAQPEPVPQPFCAPSPLTRPKETSLKFVFVLLKQF